MSGTGDVKQTKKINGPWEKMKNNESKELRPPKNLTSDLSIPASAKEGGKTDQVKDSTAKSQNLSEVQNQKVLNSTLNANAAEFVPLSSQKSSGNINNVNQDEQIQDVITYLKEELNYLTLNPGKYDETVPPLLEVIEPCISNENALQAIVSEIIEECIAEPNLRYNGARLCSDLHEKFPQHYYMIRNVFINRCEEIHNELIANAYTSDAAVMNRIQGFGMLLAELFLQIKLNKTSKSPMICFGLGIVKILQIILQNESEKGVKSACQILKLAGKQLEELVASNPTKDGFSEHKKNLDDVFSRLQSICNYVDLDPNLRFIVTSVLDMRASNWGDNSPRQSPIEEIHSNTEFFNDPVFFGPDGKVISEEETSFLQESVPFSEDTEDYVCEQEMDEEVYKDFQKFLKLNQS